MEQKENFIFITGASSGIGRCLAVNLSRSSNIIIHGRKEERLEETRSLCSADTRQLIFNFDLSKVNELESALSSFISQNNIEISNFVHCAGFLKMIPLKMVTLELINTTFATNITSANLIVKLLINRKINNSALESAVFISSNISNFGAKAFSTYAASKGALDSLMRCLAVELAPKVRINSVLPGGIETEMTRSVYENKEVIDRIFASYPLGS